MDAQDFRSLQEAYMEVVKNQQLDEGLKKYPWGAVVKQIRRKEKSNPESAKELQRRHERLRDLTSNELGQPKYRLQDSEKTKKEQVDLYDIILSHLLDEGYVETLEAAEAVMVNMSEEWRDDIIESIGTGPFGPDDKEDPRYDPEKLIKHYWNSRIFRSKRPDELPTRSKEDRKKQKQILRKMRIDRK